MNKAGRVAAVAEGGNEGGSSPIEAVESKRSDKVILGFFFLPILKLFR